MSDIHSTAIISDQAKIGNHVTIGPFTVILGEAEIGDGCRIENHVTIGSPFGKVTVGKNNHILPGAVVGGPPQDLSYKNDPTDLIIGDNNVLREFVTVNKGTVKGGGVTRLGNDNLLMAYVHIAHDCQISNKVVIANACHFAGHVTVEEDVKIGGGCLFNQFITVGCHSFIAGGSVVHKDILPCTIAQGTYAKIRATNKIGLERAGFRPEEVANVHKAIRLLIKGERTVEQSVELIQSECLSAPMIEHIIQFVKASQRGMAL